MLRLFVIAVEKVKCGEETVKKLVDAAAALNQK